LLLTPLIEVDVPAVLTLLYVDPSREIPDGAGVTVRVEVRVTPAKAAEIVTAVDAATTDVVTANVAVVAPAATVTLAGTVADDALLLPSVTTAPPTGAPADSVTVPVDPAPPTTLAGLTVTELSAATAGTGVTVMIEVRVTPA
jgi:hypothetical protein